MAEFGGSLVEESVEAEAAEDEIVVPVSSGTTGDASSSIVSPEC